MKAGPEAEARAYQHQQEQMARNSKNLEARLIEKFLTEPDREYAIEFWGSMLTERGVDITKLA